MRKHDLLAAVVALALAGMAAAQAPRPAAKKKPLPLEPERTVEFTTDEGTWISLDLSPDAKTIVFELLGDLYTIPIEGGEARRITSGMAFDTQPRFSPDGKLIAFLSDREGSENVFIAKPDGSDIKQLSRDPRNWFASPAWTPDGEYVIASRRTNNFGNFDLWMYHVQGGSGVAIAGSAAAVPAGPQQQPRPSALGAVASPDGRYFYYARKATGGIPYNATLPMWQIARRDRITGDEDVLTQAVGSAMRPLVSPDGSRLVYGTRHETETGLRVREIKTGEDRWLKYPVTRDDQEASAHSRDLLPGYAFTPDGKELVVSYGGKIHRVDVTTGESRNVPFTARVSQQLGPQLSFPRRVDEGPVRARLIQEPRQSPDGKRLAFSALTKLYVMDLPDGTPARLTSANAREFQPAWSPDGQWIAYVTFTTQDEGHIWRVRADRNAPPQQLTRVPAFYGGPAWSPDGTRIVALRTRRGLGGGGIGAVDLIWIPAEGGDATVIASGRAGRPRFTNDKDRIFLYGTGAPAARGLTSMRWDGTDLRTHIRIVGRSQGPQPAPASDAAMSPDGQWVLAAVNNQLHLVTVPRIGGEPPTVNVNSASVPVKKLTDVGVDSFAWADGGATITWGLGSTFFRLKLADVGFEPEKRPAPAEFEVALEQPRHRPSGSIVLRGARVITMRGDEVIADADIVVTDNRIAAVGRRGAAPVPAGAKIQDVSGSTIMPGIVDVHAHWRAFRGGTLETQLPDFLANLAYGVTTGRDPQTGSNDMFAYQDLVDAGEMLGPRAFSTGPGVFADSDFQSLDDARKTVARYKKHYRTNTLKSYLVGNRKQRQWMVEACREHQIMPTTEGGLDLELDLTHAIDGFSGNEHSLPIVPLYKDVVELYARSGIYYTPTLLVAYGGPFGENYFFATTDVHNDAKLRRFFPHTQLDSRTQRRQWFRPDEHIFSRIAAGAAQIVRAGGRVSVGGHGQLQGLQCHWEMWALSSGGMTNMEVLRAATLHGAEAIGFAQDLGSIEAGKLADLIVLTKDPLQDIHNTNTIRYVMKNGELFEGDTLNQLWPQQKPLPPLWWSKDDP